MLCFVLVYEGKGRGDGFKEMCSTSKRKKKKKKSNMVNKLYFNEKKKKQYSCNEKCLNVGTQKGKLGFGVYYELGFSQLLLKGSKGKSSAKTSGFLLERLKIQIFIVINQFGNGLNLFLKAFGGQTKDPSFAIYVLFYLTLFYLLKYSNLQCCAKFCCIAK